MKKFLMAFALAAVMLTGCKAEEIPVYTEIGTDINGRMTVSGSWAQIDEENNNKVSFSRQETEGYTYITFNTIDMTGTDDNLYTLTYTSHAYRDFYTEAGMTRVGIGGNIKMGEYEAKAVNGYFTNGENEGYCETYMFFDENGNLHLITAEGTKEAVKALSRGTETYTFDSENLPLTEVYTENPEYDGDFSPYEE